MPVYQFFCEKHGSFEKITIKAEWGDIRCPKCGSKPQMDEKNAIQGQKAGLKISRSYLKNSRSSPRANRGLTKKRSIGDVCEHFEEAHSEAIGR